MSVSVLMEEARDFLLDLQRWFGSSPPDKKHAIEQLTDWWSRHEKRVERGCCQSIII
jgi:hypothetical protein